MNMNEKNGKLMKQKYIFKFFYTKQPKIKPDIMKAMMKKLNF